MRALFRGAFRFVVVTLIEALSLLLMAAIVPGIALQPPRSAFVFTAAISVALVLAIINGVVRPVLILLTLPLNVRTFGFSTLLINGAMLLLAGYFLPYFVVMGVFDALVGSLILAIVNTILTSLTTIDDDYAFFDGVTQWLSRRRLMIRHGERGRGLVLLEIDGLSYQRVQAAIESGMMPTLRALQAQGTHQLSRFDCGLPSQTSACQAGIMYGDNYDIPAFRWYEKERGKLLVSNNFADAAEINGRFAKGKGLLRGGTSINNLMSGDARKTLLTMSVLTEGPADIERRSSEDLYLVFLNPYFFARLIILTLWDVLVELGQALRQLVRNEQPRVNRLHKAYPILRALSNVFLRDLGTYVVILDVIRGSPAIYTTFFGYDEIAHHAGPDSRDALHSLKGIDTQIRRILDVINRKAPRPYDLLVLSDHGQSFGATFRQRYGHTLKEFIAGLVHGTAVGEVNASEESQGYTAALLAEIQTMEERLPMGRVREAAFGRARQALQNRLERDAPPPLMDEDVIVGVSGNLANVYFDLHVGKVNMLTLNEIYPILLDALVGHPGIGLVVAHDHEDVPWVLGKKGARNLQTGAITQTVHAEAVDPLRPYGDPELRAAQLKRLAEFPHAGDLILISTVYPDGTVAAFEELVGSHGGLGGQQTDAFLFHPADMDVPPTSNAADMFALLNARRGRLAEPMRRTERPSPPRLEERPWSPRALLAGILEPSTWLLRLLLVLRLDRGVLRQIAQDPLATGPALLIVLVSFSVLSLQSALRVELPGTFLVRLAGPFVSLLVGWLAVAALGHYAGRFLRGRGTFTRTLRTLAYAQAPSILAWLQPVPGIGPLLATVAILMTLVTTWMALQEALALRRRVAILLPLVGLLLAVVGLAALGMVFSGVALTLETILDSLGLALQP